MVYHSLFHSIGMIESQLNHLGFKYQICVANHSVWSPDLNTDKYRMLNNDALILLPIQFFCRVTYSADMKICHRLIFSH